MGMYWQGYKTEFEKIDFNFIQEKFTLERIDSQKIFSSNHGFNLSNYQKETQETFRNFKELTDHIINIYKDCVYKEKDLIICFD